MDHSPSTKATRHAPRPGVTVPSWYDLPLLLPDTDPVVGRLQRDFLETLGSSKDPPPSQGFVVPKVSLLSPSHSHWRNESGKRVLVRPRKTIHGGAAVVLDRLAHPNQSPSNRPTRRRERLRDKLWKDLQRFGLWHIDRVGGEMVASWDDDVRLQRETVASVDAAVESILSQLQSETTDQQDREEMEECGDDSMSVNTDAVFLTAMPTEKTVEKITGALPEAPDSTGEQPNEAMDDDNDPEEDEDEQDEPTESLASRFRREIEAPGLKRRQRLKDLHVFVEKQLQKRLYRSWETIEIALAGSGDLSVHQIVKFLQNSDVKLSAVDAAKVQSILHQHLDNQRVAKEKAEAAAAETASVQATTTTRASKISYTAFRKIFQPRDTSEAARWKHEFDRDKVRFRQEKEVYDRELAILEEKVKKRLAESAKHMVEVLDSFRCDPLALPWTTDTQRLELRNQFLHVIFSKPTRRRLSLAAAAIRTSVTANGSVSAIETQDSSVSASSPAHDLPDKISVPQVCSALLQKYSRNGHFEAVDVLVAAYIFHDLAADVIKTSIRAFWTRRATDLWPERQLIFQFRLKKAVFYEWKRFTKHAEVLRLYVLRKFVVWAFWTRCRLAYYAFYRTCFWPFYVWKRHLQRMILARGKSSFLKNVVETYIQLCHFRAWKTRYRRKTWCRNQVLRLCTKKTKQMLRICWHDWYERFHVHMQIHRLWKSRGHVLQQLHKGYMVKVTFLVWRYYVILKQDMAARRFKCFHTQFPPIEATRTRMNQSSPAKGRTPNAPLSPARGISWAAQPNTMNSLAGRSASMATAYGTSTRMGIGSLDVGIDSFVQDEDENEPDEPRVDETTRTLSKIMETDLAPKIKRKTRLYDLCLNLYLRFRERDRREMTGNIILFRRIGHAFFRGMKTYISYRKKNRMATDLGAFRLLYRRFRWWVAIALYKQPATTDKENDSEYTNTDGDEAHHRHEKLDWKADTEWRQRGLAHLSVEADKLRNDLLAIATANAERLECIQDLEVQLRERRRFEEVFLRKEAGATLKVRALQMQQAQQILRTRGHRLHDVLDRAFDTLRAQQRRYQLKSTFRGLRVTMMERYTTTLCHHAQLRNWIRLCRRFMFWERNAGRFYIMRLKFRTFRTLLRFVVWKWKHESPGWSATLQKRQRLMHKYEQFLAHHNLLDGSTAAAQLALTKYSPANTFHGVFLRWVQYTQIIKSHREHIAIMHRKHELERVYTVFQTFKTHLKAKYTVAKRRSAMPFLWRQCIADLDAGHCKVLALHARLPSQRLRNYLQLTQRQLQHAATGVPTLKQRFQRHEHEVRQRVFLESRLLIAAYSERRVHHYVERRSALFGAPVGRSFATDDAPPYGSISEVVLLGGKHVDAVSLVLKTLGGTTVETALHGNAFGNRDAFVLARGEKLVTIEGFASQTIYALRLGTSTGRHSKWFGLVDKGTRFELRSDWHGTREEIVGLFGYADATSVHALGCVFRRTTQRNVFEGMWLNDPTPSPSDATIAALDATDSALCDRQFAYFLQVRLCDVLLAMKRAHRFARRVQRLAPTLPMALGRPRIVLALMRWFFNSQTHGLVHASDREDEGQRLLQQGLAAKANGEKQIEEGTKLLADVESYRDSDQQLNVATIGTKKLTELMNFMEQGQAKIALGQRLVTEGEQAIVAGQRLLPHLPQTTRMMKAIKRMYKVVQTKDYIDQMDPELRAILLEGDGGASGTPQSIYEPV